MINKRIYNLIKCTNFIYGNDIHTFFITSFVKKKFPLDFNKKSMYFRNFIF